jgi:hypothetical protein
VKVFFKRYIRLNVGSSVINAKLVDPRAGIYELQQMFSYYIRYRGVSYVFIIPKGFLTNFATVPKWAWGIFHPTENAMLVAACVHDFILNEQRQTNIGRNVVVDGNLKPISEVIDGFLAADLFFFSLSQEGSYNLLVRQFLRLCVKGYYFASLKGWVRVR